MGGEDCAGVAFAEERGEGFVAEIAGGFFDGLVVGAGVSGGGYCLDLEGDLEGIAQLLDEGLVDCGLGAAEGVVDMDRGEADTEGVFGKGVGGVEEEEEGCGVGASGDGAADAFANADRGGG